MINKCMSKYMDIVDTIIIQTPHCPFTISQFSFVEVSGAFVNLQLTVNGINGHSCNILITNDYSLIEVWSHINSCMVSWFENYNKEFVDKL